LAKQLGIDRDKKLKLPVLLLGVKKLEWLMGRVC
jgi:hypothetical protein